ncbi:MAG TPA: peroxide stress protein YaaA [Actinomycetes bacterium]|nr:peroxide stress protein YaaA [Actinomycetes bacterium]
MLILLPPSEGKAATDAGKPFDLDRLSLPELNPTRIKVLDALVRLSAGRASRAREVLGLSVKQNAELERNRELQHSNALPAAQVYTGVLYAALDYPSLTPAARRRVNRTVSVASALWGAVRLDDRIPAYRLSGDVTLPRVGPIAKAWRAPLSRALPAAAGSGVVLDLRSGTYAKMWRPDPDLAERTAVARVLLERPDGTRVVASHHNKATKGRLVRALVSQTSTPRSVDEVATLIEKLGFIVELSPGRPGARWHMDVVVEEL